MASLGEITTQNSGKNVQLLALLHGACPRV